MIQRPWDGTFDEYLTYSLRDQNPQREHSASQLKHTDAGRDVYGGGGIDPDKFMVGSAEGFNPTRFSRGLVARGAFANFADQFTAEGDTRLSAANKNKKPLGKGFTLTDAMVADFRESLKAQKVVMDEAAFTKDETFIRAMIRYDIDVALFGTSEARKNLIGKDPQAQFALAQFPDAVRLTTLSTRKQ
jgi:carboxyl-terminal processing protease